MKNEWKRKQERKRERKECKPNEKHEMEYNFNCDALFNAAHIQCNTFIKIKTTVTTTTKNI